MTCLFPFPIIQRCLRKSSIALFLILITNSAWANSTIQLDWESSPSPNVNGYQVYMGTSPGAYSTTKDVGLAHSAQFPNMHDGHTYYFSVTAYDQHHTQSSLSEEVSVTLPDTTPPTPPEHVHLTSTSETEVIFEWTASTDNVGVTAYEVARNNTILGQTSTTTYTDTTATPGFTYHYTVRAKDANGNFSDWSQPLQVITAQAEVTLTVSISGKGTITSLPNGIHCPTQECTSTYPVGTAVELTAAPAKGWFFQGWSGYCTTTTKCSITIEKGETITAKFSKNSQMDRGIKSIQKGKKPKKK